MTPLDVYYLGNCSFGMCGFTNGVPNANSNSFKHMDAPFSSIAQGYFGYQFIAVVDQTGVTWVLANSSVVNKSVLCGDVVSG